MNSVLRIFEALYFPQRVFEKRRADKWYLYMLIPAACFMTTLLQSGLDKLSVGIISGWEVLWSALLGTVCGCILTALTTGIIMLTSKITKTDIDPCKTMQAVSECFFFPLLISFTGLIINIFFRQNTSVLFGITSILFSIIPLYSLFLFLNFGGIKKRKFYAVPAATVIACIYLTAVALLMKM